jgi:hypothetical protein
MCLLSMPRLRFLAPPCARSRGAAPELSEIEIIRHFTRLSTWNYAIDLGMYPLGSCTMKYNPRVNEFVARIEGLAEAHPYRPDALAQGILEVFDLLQRCLLEITGMDAITLQPAAGAHGEFTGILLTRAWHESQGNPRKKVLHSRLGARHQPGHGGLQWLHGRESQIERRRRHRSGGARAARGRRNRCADAHQPFDAGRLRKRDSQDRRHSARQRRAALHGRRQHECAGGQGAPRRLRRGRDAPEPAQDLLHAARRRRAGIGTRGVQEVSRAFSAHPGSRPRRERCEALP